METKTIKLSVKRSIANILRFGITDVEVFNRPFEIELLKKEQIQNNIVTKIADRIKLAYDQQNIEFLELKPISHVLVPKKDFFDFRKCALIDIIDEIIFLTLTLLIAKDVEKSRIKKRDDLLFSYRVDLENAEEGYIFDPKYNFTEFRNAVRKKSKLKENNIMISCDISNFYDRLNLHRLENNLLSIKSIDSKVVKLINEVLLFWSERDSYGLPVGSNASRILAEAALIEVDEFLKNQKIKFCRFVDDYRIFTSDASDAHRVLSLLVEKLSRTGLFLNLSKTKIEDISMLFDEVADISVETSQTIEVNESKIINEKITSEIIRGYSGLIPLKFRKLTQKTIDGLQDQNIIEIKTKLASSATIEADLLLLFFKSVVAQNSYQHLEDASTILQKFPQFIPYFIDIINKYKNNMDRKTIEKIQTNIFDWFKNNGFTEYLFIYIIRLYDPSNFKEKSILLDFFRGLKRNVGNYIGRAILELIYGNLSRSEALEIREYYKRSDLLEKRQIIKIMIEALPKEELKPFFKNIIMTERDLFIITLINTNK